MAEPAKTYSRHNVRTNALGASVYANDVPAFTVSNGDKNFNANSPSSMEKSANYKLFLEGADDVSMYLNDCEPTFSAMSDSPQDVAGVIAVLSPPGTPTLWSHINKSVSLTLEQTEQSFPMDTDFTAPTEMDTMDNPKLEVIETPIRIQLDVADGSCSTDVAEHGLVEDFSNDDYICSDAGMARIRAAVQANMTKESMGWVKSAWISCIAEQLNITSGITSLLKNIVKEIVVDEMTPLLSQTQDSFADESFYTSKDISNDPNDGSSSDVASEGSNIFKINAAVNNLLCAESADWSVNIWMVKVAKELQVEELTAEDKLLLKDIVYNALDQMLSQTQGGDGASGFLDADNSEPSVADSEDEASLTSAGEKRKGKNISNNSKKRTKVGVDDEHNESEISGKNEKEPVKVNEELMAVQAIDEGVSARAQAVHELIYRDREELEIKQAEMRNKVLEKIRSKVNPHLKQINVAAIDSLRNMDKSIDNQAMLRDIVKVFVREDALAAANSAVINDEFQEQKNADFVNLSDEDGDDSDGSDVENDGLIAPTAAPPLKSTVAFLNGGLRMGMVKPLFGNRSRLKAELMSRAQDHSAARLATKVGVSSSEDLTRVLGYTESVRKTHAALKAEEDRIAREREEQDIREKDERRRLNRLNWQAKDDDSEGEFDENDESFLKPVTGARILSKDEDLSDEDSNAVSAANSDDEVVEDDEEELDEDAKLAELEIMERERAEREHAQEELASMVATAGSAAIRQAEPSTHIDDHEHVDFDATTNNDLEDSKHGGTIVDKEDGDPSNGAGEEREKVVKIHKSRNENYVKVLLADQKKAKQRPGASFIDDEAEEEEEEGLQRGLEDFGFGKASDRLEAEQEEDADRIRKSDLEGVVDELSDGEGDEEEGAIRRMEEEAKRDRQLQMKIVRSLAEGNMSRSNGSRNGRGHFGIDQLTKGDIGHKGQSADDEGAVKEDVIGIGEDFEDDDALLGKLLTSMTERVKASRDARKGESDEEFSDNESVGDVDEDGIDDSERTEAARQERRLRKEKELIMTRSWMEKGRMKSALQEEDRKKRKKEMLDLIGNLDAPLNSGYTKSNSVSARSTDSMSFSRSKTIPAFGPAAANVQHLSLLDDVASLGRPDSSPPFPRTSRLKIGAIATTSAMSAPTTTPRVFSVPNEASTVVGFAAPVLPASLSAVTHRPQIKKSLKRSASDIIRPLAIDTRLHSTTGVDSEALLISSGSDSNSGFPNTARVTSTSRSARNGYNGNLVDGSAAHCMGMAFADNSMSCAPDGALLPCFGSDSQSGIGLVGRKMSFINTVTSASGGASFRGPSPTSSAVTVAGQAYVFGGLDSASRSGIGSDSNSGFFGPDSTLGGGGNSNSGFGDLSNAPALKRSKSSVSSTSLMGIAQSCNTSNMRGQTSTGSLTSLNRSHSVGNNLGNRKSIQETIGVSGKNSKSKSTGKKR